MEQSRRAASFLASVRNEREARLCAALGADIIDAKNPREGALGALPVETVRAIRAAVPAHIAVSATIGDPGGPPEAAAEAAARMAAAGVDFVKVGFAAGSEPSSTLAGLARRAPSRARLVGVLLVDRGLDLALIGPLRAAGFVGAMLDTGDKRRGALPDLVPAAALAGFVQAAREARLFAGFAGSLTAEHVPYLLGFGPDLLGFRGGLCAAGAREAALDPAAVGLVRAAIPCREGPPPCRTLRPDAMARRQPEGAL